MMSSTTMTFHPKLLLILRGTASSPLYSPPIALAILRLCDQQASSRWLADLLGGPANTKTGKR
jgi:hypothetical protein